MSTALSPELERIVREKTALINRLHSELRGRRPAKSAWVYFIQQEGGNGPVKIGRACSPRSRLEEFQTGSPVVLRLLACAPGGAALEAQLHRQFAHLRLHGEWFQDSPELMEFINGIDRPE